MNLRIREAAETVGLSADTLRYYEKIDLVPRPARAAGGQRRYGEKDLARLRFVVRAQALGFALKEIRQLLRFREDPVRCSKPVRELARDKCGQLAAQQQAIEQMQRELALLLSLCAGASDHCPILDRLESDDARADGTSGLRGAQTSGCGTRRTPHPRRTPSAKH